MKFATLIIFAALFVSVLAASVDQSIKVPVEKKDVEKSHPEGLPCLENMFKAIWAFFGHAEEVPVYTKPIPTPEQINPADKDLPGNPIGQETSGPVPADEPTKDGPVYTKPIPTPEQINPDYKDLPGNPIGQETSGPVPVDEPAKEAAPQAAVAE